MLRFHTLALAAGLLALPLAAPLTAGATATYAKPAPNAQNLKFQTAASAAITKLQAGDATGALVLLDGAVKDPDFASQPPNIRYGILVLRGQAQAMTGDANGAFASLTTAATAMPEARESYYWFLYGSVAVNAGKTREAVEGLTQLYEGAHGADVPTPQLRTISYLVHDAGFFDDGGAAKRRLLEALWKWHYVPEEPVATAEGLWYDLLEMRVDAGEIDQARELLPQIASPENVKALRIDNRFISLRGDPSAHLDYAAAVDAEVARLTSITKAHPDLLEPVVALAGLLRRHNRLDEALVVANDAVARQAAATRDKPAFSDAFEQTAWIYYSRAKILERLDRREESLADMRESRAAADAYGDRISQAVNLGDRYLAVGRAKDALDSVAGVKDSDGSDYGDLAVAEVRACAYAQTGDKAKLDKTLTQMRAKANKGYGPVLSALTCAGDLDGMAKTLIAELDDPESRAGALVWVQTYLPLPHPSALEATWEAQRQAVIARPDVQAAVARYGTIESFPAFSPET